MVWGLGKSGKPVSRASIILFLEKLSKQEVLGYKEKTGKGGYRRIYHPLVDEKGFVKQLVVTIIESLMEDFPGEIKETL